ncbi:MAG: hypothetical protein R3D43_08385 [Tepidamorphaceae bacterium]
MNWAFSSAEKRRRKHRQLHHVAAAFAQRRQMNRQDMQAVEKIGPEPAGALFPLLGRGSWRRRCERGRAHPKCADPAQQYACLQRPQQLGLAGRSISQISSRNSAPPPQAAWLGRSSVAPQ